MPHEIKLLATLSNAFGPPGNEEKIREIRAIHLTKAGVPSGTVAVPCRYIHGPAAVTHIDDLRNTVTLTTEFVKAISEL